MVFLLCIIHLLLRPPPLLTTASRRLPGRALLYSFRLAEYFRRQEHRWGQGVKLVIDVISQFDGMLSLDLLCCDHHVQIVLSDQDIRAGERTN